MAQTKGSTNTKNGGKTKPKVETNDGEPKVTKRRGRLLGQKIEREPIPKIELDKNNRVKLDKWANIWQQKGIEEVDEDLKETVNEEDKGWKTMGYFPKGLNGMAQIAPKYRDELVKQKAKKDMIISAEKYIELVNKANEATIKVFKPLGLNITKG